MIQRKRHSSDHTNVRNVEWLFELRETSGITWIPTLVSDLLSLMYIFATHVFKETSQWRAKCAARVSTTRDTWQSTWQSTNNPRRQISQRWRFQNFWQSILTPFNTLLFISSFRAAKKLLKKYFPIIWVRFMYLLCSSSLKKVTQNSIATMNPQIRLLMIN